LTKFEDSLSFMTVRFAGHEVPAYQPQKALELFKRYLDGSVFHTGKDSGGTGGGNAATAGAGATDTGTGDSGMYLMSLF
jgi:hypothetical protein